ncbi:MAG: GerMN domain-containing protein [Gudongella sp.]|nr:GerMN domain-containing protein [Gudongella sp.]
MKKTILLIISLLLIFSLIGCTPKNEPVEPEEPVVEEPVEEPMGPEEPIEKSQDVVLYFGNNEYILSGDEKFDWMLPEERTIVYGPEMCLEEAIIRELMAGPVDTEKMSTGFPQSVALIGVDTLDGTSYVNFKGEGLNGGSMEESYIISQTVESLGQLDYVDRVQFLVDGQEAESLMGHISIEEPVEVDK